MDRITRRIDCDCLLDNTKLDLYLYLISIGNIAMQVAAGAGGDGE